MHILSREEFQVMYLQEDLVIQLGLVDLFHLFVLEGLQDHEDRLDLLLPKISQKKTGDYLLLRSKLQTNAGVILSS